MFIFIIVLDLEEIAQVILLYGVELLIHYPSTDMNGMIYSLMVQSERDI